MAGQRKPRPAEAYSRPLMGRDRLADFLRPYSPTLAARASDRYSGIAFVADAVAPIAESFYRGLRAPGDVARGRVSSAEALPLALETAGVAAGGATAFTRIPRQTTNRLASGTNSPNIKPQLSTGYDFPVVTRGFDRDYPQASGRHGDSRALTNDIDGRPLTARFVAGRRREGGPDVGLSEAELRGVAGHFWRSYQAPEDFMYYRGAVGEFDPNRGVIKVLEGMKGRDFVRAFSHEMGHGIEGLTGPISARGIRPQFEQIFSDGISGDPRVKMAPRDFGYADAHALEEMRAEAMRAYLTAPGYVKDRFPKVAERLRAAVNTHPELRKVLQLNANKGAAVPAQLAAQGGRLDMSLAARMQRARDMGFDTSQAWYHGTAPTGWEFKNGVVVFEGTSFDQFRPGSYFASNPEYASGFAQAQANERALGNLPRVIPTYLRMRNPYRPEDHNYWKTLRANPEAETVRLSALGHDGVIMREVPEGHPMSGDVAYVFDPRNIRSVNANFDPAHSNSANLLAANPLAGTIALSAAQRARQDGGAITVEGYTRPDGKRVEGYTRKRPKRRR